MAKNLKKLYYSIREVSEITGLKQYVLRYWETEFPELKPSKNRAGNRIYKKKDIKLIKRIKHLLYDEKYTIDGARNKLKEEFGKKESEHQQKIMFQNNDACIDENPKKLIKEIKEDINDILEMLE